MVFRSRSKQIRRQTIAGDLKNRRLLVCAAYELDVAAIGRQWHDHPHTKSISIILNIHFGANLLREYSIEKH